MRWLMRFRLPTAGMRVEVWVSPPNPPYGGSAATGTSCPPSSGRCRTGGAFVDRCDRAGYSMVPDSSSAKYVRNPGVPAAFAPVTALRGRVCKTVGSESWNEDLATQVRHD